MAPLRWPMARRVWPQGTCAACDVMATMRRRRQHDPGATCSPGPKGAAMATSGLSMLDPLNLWRDALGQWENRTNQVANQEMKSEDFARATNALLGMSLGLQQALGKANTALLKELNLPSRGELLELGERLQRIEDQLGQIARLLGAQGPAGSPAAAAMPPRTRRPAPPAAAVPPSAAPTEAVATRPPPLPPRRRPAAKKPAATRRPPARKGR